MTDHSQIRTRVPVYPSIPGHRYTDMMRVLANHYPILFSVTTSAQVKCKCVSICNIFLLQRSVTHLPFSPFRPLSPVHLFLTFFSHQICPRGFETPSARRWRREVRSRPTPTPSPLKPGMLFLEAPSFFSKITL
jgi:hypothetical protein